MTRDDHSLYSALFLHFCSLPSQLVAAIDKLFTFKLCRGVNSYTPASWKEFHETSVLSLLTSHVEEGELYHASTLWERHCVSVPGTAAVAVEHLSMSVCLPVCVALGCTRGFVECQSGAGSTAEGTRVSPVS